MFRRLPESRDGQVTLRIEGRSVTVAAGQSVAAAVLVSGLDHCRTTPVSGQPRAPYCMMGVCFDCLMEIDGEANQQACMITVREGMDVRRQRGAREVDR
ncbi:MAG: (2Fe-2S)-binding protein [Candidatus Competibacterales bacterium]|nr:(2Fe-2S)-binding protein [Candidatus Competibacterales bacterium]